MAGEPPIDFVIITSIDSELAALLQALPVEARPISAPTSAGSSYECQITTALAEGGAATYRVVVLQVGTGRVNAAIAANDAIRHWHPRAILLIGVAGGIGSDVKVGDVVIASEIIDYERQKLTEAGPQPRWEVFRTDTMLLEAARRTARGKWASQIKIKPPRRTKISCHFGPIASGDKIIASSDQIDILRRGWRNLIGADMEGAGVAATVAKASPAPGFLMIRGVSDLIDANKASADFEKWRDYAVAAAATFTVALIRDGSILPATPIVTSQADIKLQYDTLSTIGPVTPPATVQQKVRSPELAAQPPPQPAEESGEDLAPAPAEAPPPLAPRGVGIRPRLAGVTSDSAGGVDLLDIQPDVDAFASLIAARATPPPLSIGLFGEWGSGKTFFMQQVKQRVADMTEDACASDRMQKDIAYYKHIIQIEFNAWHYVEGNLWASLVEHILRKLLTMGVTPNAVQVLHGEILTKIGVQTQLQGDLQKQVNEKGDEISNIAEVIEEKTSELAKTTEEIQRINVRNILSTVFEQADVQRELGKLNELRHEVGLPKIEEGVADLQAAIAETQALTRRGTTLLMSLGRANKPGRQIFWLVLLLVAGPAIAWIVLQIGQYLTDPDTHWVSQTVAMLAAVNTWLIMLAATIRQTSRWLSERMTVIEQLKQRWDARVAKAQASTILELADLGKQRTQIEAELAAKEIQLAAAKERAQQLQAELKQATPLHLLAKFLHERVESHDYQKYLGLLAIIRRDFEQMSQFIEGENQRTLKLATLDEEREGDERRINRIVLYIDDLDRCPTDKVIQVLQAVHLLLAFPLFVVVVAVDARWIAGALHERYGGLLSAGDAASRNGTPAARYVAATPIDYLEKIFQIPFWLSPMSQKARRKLIAGILAGSIVDDAQPAEAPEVVSAIPSRIFLHPVDAEATAPPTPVDAEVAAPPTRDDGTIETIEAADATDLNPDALTIHPAELDFINALTPLLGRSPRALKRFINIYRVIKASVSSADYAAFLVTAGTNTEFPIAMFLLAIVTNAPEISQPFFAALYQKLGDYKPEQTFTAADWQSLAAPDSAPPEWAAIQAFLASKAAASLKTVHASRLAWWAQRVMRFSFQIEPGGALEWLERVAPDEVPAK